MAENLEIKNESKFMLFLSVVLATVVADFVIKLIMHLHKKYTIKAKASDKDELSNKEKETDGGTLAGRGEGVHLPPAATGNNNVDSVTKLSLEALDMSPSVKKVFDKIMNLPSEARNKVLEIIGKNEVKKLV